MRTSAVYLEQVTGIETFLKLDAVSTAYDKVYVVGSPRLANNELMKTLENLIFIRDIYEILDRVDDIIFMGNMILENSELAQIKAMGKRVFFMKDKYFDKDIEKDHKLNSMLDVSCPIVLVMGINDMCQQTRLFWEICSAMRKKQYHVMGITSFLNDELSGCVEMPESLFEKKTLKEKILGFNRFIYDISKKERPDLILIDVPGGIMNMSSLDGTCSGEYALTITAAVDADSAILSIPAHQISNELLVQLKNICRYRYTVNLIGVAMSSVAVMQELSENRTEYFSLPPEFVNRKYIEGNHFLLPVKELKGSGEYFAELILEYFNDH